MEFIGKVIAILPPKEGTSKTGNAWKAQEFVVENHDQYPRKLCFEVFGADKLEQFNIQLGEEINVSFDIDARQWQDRWFNSIRAWRIDRVGAQQAAPQQAMHSAPIAPPPAPEFHAGNNDDLPF